MKYLTMIRQDLHSRIQHIEETLNRTANALDERGKKEIKEGVTLLAKAWG